MVSVISAYTTHEREQGTLEVGIDNEKWVELGKKDWKRTKVNVGI